jgi:hypothetical protein
MTIIIILGSLLLTVVMCEWLSLDGTSKREAPVVRLGQGDYAREWWA